MNSNSSSSKLNLIQNNHIILNCYTSPPNGTSTLRKLDEICENRHALYKILNLAEDEKISLKKRNTFIKYMLKGKKVDVYRRILDNNCSQEDSEINQTAHWMMALYCCRSEDLQYYFIKSELEWFSLLYANSSTLDMIYFMKIMEWTPDDCMKKEEISSLLNNVLDIFDLDQNFYHLPFYKAPPEIISKKIGVIFNGRVYFPETHLEYYLKFKLKRQWREYLNKLVKKLPELPDNVQNHFLCRKLDLLPPKNFYVGLENIDDFAKTHYPLCMLSLHELLRAEHHLKYDCKMQYGIFLKHIGLSYTDALNFWRQEFTQKIPVQLYNSKYEYLFKHQYGKVGRKIDFVPRSCYRIIKSQPGLNQHHGCPFKHWDWDYLRNALKKDSLRPCDLEDIEDLVKAGEYKKACTRHFCGKRGLTMEDTIHSPNEFVNLSVKWNNAFEILEEGEG